MFSQLAAIHHTTDDIRSMVGCFHSLIYAAVAIKMGVLQSTTVTNTISSKMFQFGSSVEEVYDWIGWISLQMSSGIKVLAELIEILEAYRI